MHHALWLRTGTSKKLNAMEHMGCSKKLKMIFQNHAHVKRYETSDKYFAYRMEENSSASERVLRMSGHYNRLNQVGVNHADKIVIDRIL